MLNSPGRAVMEATDLCHPFLPIFYLGQPGRDLAAGIGGDFRSGIAQCPWVHHDAHPFVLHHQQHVAGGGRGPVRRRLAVTWPNTVGRPQSCPRGDPAADPARARLWL